MNLLTQFQASLDPQSILDQALKAQQDAWNLANNETMQKLRQGFAAPALAPEPLAPAYGPDAGGGSYQPPSQVSAPVGPAPDFAGALGAVAGANPPAVPQSGGGGFLGIPGALSSANDAVLGSLPFGIGNAIQGHDYSKDLSSPAIPYADQVAQAAGNVAAIPGQWYDQRSPFNNPLLDVGLPTNEQALRFAAESSVPRSLNDLALMAGGSAEGIASKAAETLPGLATRYGERTLATAPLTDAGAAVRAPGAFLGEGRIVSPTEGEGLAGIAGGAAKKGEKLPSNIGATQEAGAPVTDASVKPAGSTAPAPPSSLEAQLQASIDALGGKPTTPLPAVPSTRTNAAATARFRGDPVVDAEKFQVSQLWAKDMPNPDAATLNLAQKRTGLYNAGLESLGSKASVEARYAQAEASKIRLPQSEPPSGMPDATDIMGSRAPQRQAARAAVANAPTTPVTPPSEPVGLSGGRNQFPPDYGLNRQGDLPTVSDVRAPMHEPGSLVQRGTPLEPAANRPFTGGVTPPALTDAERAAAGNFSRDQNLILGGNQPNATRTAPPAGAPPPRNPAIVAMETSHRDSNAIVEEFKRSLAGTTKDMRVGEQGAVRGITSKIGGDLNDPYLTELTNQEGQLHTALVRNETAKLPHLPRGASLEEQQAALEKITNIIDAETKRVSGFREDSIARRYTGDARIAASNALKARDTELLAQGYNPLTGVTTNKFDQAQSILKEMMLGADLGVVLQQGLRALRVGSSSILSGGLGRSVERIAQALGKGEVGGWIYPNKEISQSAQRAAYGFIERGAASVGLPRGVKTAEQLAADASRSLPAKIARAPLNASRALSDIQYKSLDKVRTLIFDGRMYQAKLMGQDISNPQLGRSISDFANMAGSTARTATNPGRALVESRTVLSPQLTRGAFAEMAAPLKTLRSATDAMNTVNQVASAAALFGTAYAINDQIGITTSAKDFANTVMNPLSPDFGKLTLKAKNSNGENIVWNFLPQFSAEKAILTSLRTTVAATKGDKSASETLTAIADAAARYGSGRVNTGLSTLQALGGFGYGNDGKFYYGDMPIKERLINAIPGPITAMQAITSGEHDPVSLGSNILGGSTYGESPFTATDRQIQQDIKEGKLPATVEGPDGQRVPITDYDLLSRADPNAAKAFDERNPELAKSRVEASRDTTKQADALNKDLYSYQQDLDNTLLNTNPAEWRTKSGDAAHNTAIRIDQVYASAGAFNREPRTYSERVAKEFHDILVQAGADEKAPISSQIDWDKVDALTKEQSQHWNDQLLQNRLKGETKPRQEFLQAQPVLQPYFEQRDMLWNQLAQGDPEMSQYKTFDDFRDSLVSDLHDGGYGWTEARSKVDAKLQKYSAVIGKYSDVYLAENADEVLPLLDKYDYFVPERFQKYVRR